MVFNPAVAADGTLSFFGRISVSGPGKKASISFAAISGISLATCSS
jgi:hypothetical protein